MHRGSLSLRYAVLLTRHLHDAILVHYSLTYGPCAGKQEHVQAHHRSTPRSGFFDREGQD